VAAHLRTQSSVSDAVQRDNGYAFAKMTLIDEILANLRVLDNDVIQPPPAVISRAVALS